MCVSINGPGDLDLLTSKLVCESHQRWGTFPPNLDTLALWVLDFFAMYATDRVRRTDGQTVKRTEGRTKATLIALSLLQAGIKIVAVQG